MADKVDAWMYMSWITVFYLTIVQRSSAIFIQPIDSPSRRLNENDTTFVEWRVRTNSGEGDPTSGRLLFRHGVSLLSEFFFDTRSRSNTSAHDSDPRLQFISTGVGRYGYKINNIRTRDAGIYTASFREYEGFPEQAHSNITLFVFGFPTTPRVTPQTSITVGNDVILKCVSESQSMPPDMRPAMKFQWFRNGKQSLSGSGSGSKYDISDAYLTIKNVNDGNDVFECEAYEEGSAVSARSKPFPIVLIRIQNADTDPDEIKKGANINLAWKVLDMPETPPEYNHSLEFSFNGVELAQYNLRYRHFQPADRLLHRLAYFSPGTGSYGFRLYDVKPEDIGEYTCTYTDEFGSVVRSQATKLKLLGHTFPTITYTSKPYTVPKTESNNEKDDSRPSTIQESEKPGMSPSTESQIGTQTIVLGSAVGVACFIILLIIIVAIVFITCKRRKKVPETLLRNRNALQTRHNGGDLPDDASRYSVYDRLAESMMVTDDMVLAGPSLPNRDDTYNQAFENTRRVAQPARSLSIPGHASPVGANANDAFCRPDDDVCGATSRKGNSLPANRRQFVRSLTERPDVEENAYLTPVTLRNAAKYSNTEGQCSASPATVDSAETPENPERNDSPSGNSYVPGPFAYKPPKAEEPGYLSMGEDRPPQREMGDVTGDPYITMHKECIAPTKPEGEKFKDEEYVNILKKSPEVVDVSA